jgi:hypothetical protein
MRAEIKTGISRLRYSQNLLCAIHEPRVVTVTNRGSMRRDIPQTGDAASRHAEQCTTSARAGARTSESTDVPVRVCTRSTRSYGDLGRLLRSRRSRREPAVRCPAGRAQRRSPHGVHRLCNFRRGSTRQSLNAPPSGACSMGRVTVLLDQAAAGTLESSGSSDVASATEQGRVSPVHSLGITRARTHDDIAVVTTGLVGWGRWNTPAPSSPGATTTLGKELSYSA